MKTYLEKLYFTDTPVEMIENAVLSYSYKRFSVFQKEAKTLLHAICLYVKHNPEFKECEKSLFLVKAILKEGRETINAQFDRAAKVPELEKAVKEYRKTRKYSENLFANLQHELKSGINEIDKDASGELAQLMTMTHGVE